MPVEDVYEAARRRHLDFFMLTDHNCLGAAGDVRNLPKDGPLPIVGVEVEDPDHNNHYLVFGANQVITGVPAREYMTGYAQLGATTIIAHPKEFRATNRYRKYEWTEEIITEASAIEVWNYVSHWLGHLHEKLNGLLLLWFPGWFVRKPLRRALRMWDQANLRGERKTGIGSVDAHGMWHSLWGIRFRILPHRYLFRTIRTNILIPEGTPFNESSVLEAIRNGRCYIVNYLLGEPEGFYAGICAESGEAVTYGEEIAFESGLRFYFRMHRPAEVRLYGNGRHLATQKISAGWFPITEPGFYRLEINRYRYGWIYTNPIYVIGKEQE
jgi:hypothetical protein